MAAVAGADLVLERLGLFQVTAGLEIGKDGLARFSRGHAGVFAAVEHLGLALRGAAAGDVFVRRFLFGGAGHAPVVGEGAHDRQVMPFADLEVVRVVGGGDLDHAGAFFEVGVLVEHDRDLFVEQRQNHVAAVQVLIALVFGVDRHGGIAEHSLGSGGGELELFARLFHGIEKMPEMGVLLFILHLGVGNGRVAAGAPVDHAVAAVDEPLVIELHEHLFHGVGAALVEREALAVPVAGRAHFLELFDDAAAVLLFPVPRAHEKALSAEVFFFETLFAHRFNDLRLGGDGGVVGAGEP